MKVGIVGLQQSGKTTLFKAITRGEAPIDEYGTKPNIGVVPVPDHKLDWLVEINHPKKITPAMIEFIDGAAKVGEDQRGKFGSDFFADVRAVEALIQIVRVFTNASGDAPAPSSDVRGLTEELILADLVVVENRLERLEKSLHGTKQGATTPNTIERDLLLQIKEILEAGQLVKSVEMPPEQQKTLSAFDFMTGKPQIVVANIPEDEIGQPESDAVKELRAYCDEQGLPMTTLSAKVEAEVAELPDDEQREYLDALGLQEPARDRLINETYKALGLIRFYTAGEPEVRAYSIPKGMNVVDASGKIHSDIARGFIRAEIGHFDDVKAAGGWEEAKRANLVELHMKDYTMRDGDIVYIRFKV